MARIHRLAFVAVSLVLGVGGLQSAGAQDSQPASAADAGPAYPQRAPVTPAVSPDGRPIAAGEWAVKPSSPPDGGTRPASSAPDKLVPLASDQGIRYLSGGVGDSERTELDAMSHQYNLRLLFAMQGSGEYLSAVRVNILDARSVPRALVLRSLTASQLRRRRQSTRPRSTTAPETGSAHRRFGPVPPGLPLALTAGTWRPGGDPRCRRPGSVHVTR